MGQARDRSRLAGVGGYIPEYLRRGVQDSHAQGTPQLSAYRSFTLSHALFLQRLGLRHIDSDDESKLNRPLLNLLDEHHLDFHSTFRRLAYFRPHFTKVDGGEDADTTELDSFIESLLSLTPESQMLDPLKAKADWKKWLKKYAERVESEKDLWTGDESVDLQRERAIRGANPRFVLRQWVLEEVIKKVEKDSTSGRRVLRKVLQVRFFSSKCPIHRCECGSYSHYVLNLVALNT